MANGETGQLPLGFTMALAQNLEAMNNFTALPEAEQHSVIERAKRTNSKGEMQQLVQSLS